MERSRDAHLELLADPEDPGEEAPDYVFQRTVDPVGSGRIVYLDPWKNGEPDHFENDEFKYRDGYDWAHTVTHTHEPGDPPRDPGDD